MHGVNFVDSAIWPFEGFTVRNPQMGQTFATHVR